MKKTQDLSCNSYDRTINNSRKTEESRKTMIPNLNEPTCNLCIPPSYTVITTQ